MNRVVSSEGSYLSLLHSTLLIMRAFLLQVIVGLDLLAKANAHRLKDRQLETITISTELFTINPTNIVLDSTTIFPGSAAVTILGEVISADSSGDLFVDSTEILSGVPNTAVSNPTASSSTA